jgi:hypothetical protein
MGAAGFSVGAAAPPQATSKMDAIATTTINLNRLFFMDSSERLNEIENDRSTCFLAFHLL